MTSDQKATEAAWGVAGAIIIGLALAGYVFFAFGGLYFESPYILRLIHTLLPR